MGSNSDKEEANKNLLNKMSLAEIIKLSRSTGGESRRLSPSWYLTSDKVSTKLIFTKGNDSPDVIVNTILKSLHSDVETIAILEQTMESCKNQKDVWNLLSQGRRLGVG